MKTKLLFSCLLSILFSSVALADASPERTLQKLSYGNSITFQTQPQSFQSAPADECIVTVRTGSIQPKLYVDQNLVAEAANKIEPITVTIPRHYVDHSPYGGAGWVPATTKMEPSSISFTVNVNKTGSLIQIEPNAQNENIDADVICSPVLPPYDMLNNPG